MTFRSMLSSSAIPPVPQILLLLELAYSVSRLHGAVLAGCLTYRIVQIFLLTYRKYATSLTKQWVGVSTVTVPSVPVLCTWIIFKVPITNFLNSVSVDITTVNTREKNLKMCVLCMHVPSTTFSLTHSECCFTAKLRSLC